MQFVKDFAKHELDI